MIDSDSLPLPEFDRPPVVETVLSAQFKPIADMRTVHYGLFWRQIRDTYPGTEEKPALEPSFERFGGGPKRTPRLHFEAKDEAHPERMWFSNREGTELIQLQVDRFIKNWRQIEDRNTYPRYEGHIKPAFARDLQIFEKFLAEESLAPIEINQCEVTYVNHIVAGEGWESWSDVAKIFSFLGGMPASLEDGQFAFRMPILVKNQPIGRLIVEIQPALSERDDRPMWVMNLTARGLVGTGTEFFDFGRAAIVKSFAELTTAAMHKVWRRRQ